MSSLKALVRRGLTMKVAMYHYLLSALLIGFGFTESPPLEDIPGPAAERATAVPQESTLTPEDKFELAVDCQKKEWEEKYLNSHQCLQKQFTNLSCKKVFCPPWMRCIEERCECKLPYMCDKGTPVCSHNKRTYHSFCQVKAVECLRQITTFSHLGSNCAGDSFDTLVMEDGVVMVKVPQNGTFLVCGEGWDIPAANIVCRHKKGQDKGAVTASFLPYKQTKDYRLEWQPDCVSVECMGFENSLAECTIRDKRPLENDTKIAKATCVEDTRACLSSEFTCANGKCISLEHACDSVNDCVDGSDEMCCKACRKGFHCKSDVCIPMDSVSDGIVDCLGGEDEIQDPVIDRKPISPIKQEIKIARNKTETLVCGKPNDVHSETTPAITSRRKRVVGGEVAGKTQFPWQVAIQEGDIIDCGGIYIGECWVLTAAHCVRPKPEAYRIKFSLWSKLSKQDTTDLALVEKVIIHHKYNPTTYQNDIALLQLEKLPYTEKCIHDNPAIAPACVPWSEYQFKPGDECMISGWGRQADDKKTMTLRWANIEIIGNCSGIYGPRYFDGMECAGSLDGSVDTCQGDSGGPLVCEDALGVAYAWGIVSWGEKCGVAGYPGVYTKVAYYYDWISMHIGKSKISRYNV